MSNIIIIDHKSKRKNSDTDWTDALGLEEAKRNKANTIEISKDTTDTVERFLLEHSPNDLIGKKVWVIFANGARMWEGWVVDVYASKHLLCKVNGENRPVDFKHVISIGDE